MAPSARRSSAPNARIGVDTGGTFTDLVRVRDGALETAKVSSTPADPSLAVLAAIARVGGARRPGRAGEVVHGTTVALNALLTGRTARAALVTNAGFRDLIEIGRQERPDIYALHPQKPTPIVPRERRFEVAQRSWPGADGALEEAKSPSRAELERLRRAIAKSGAESVAVCLLHAYAEPEIERRIARALEGLGVPLTCSASILPAYREFERFSTAVVNAALVPVMRAYLERLATDLAGARLSMLQSSGGTLAAERAALEPVRVLFSGPAGGVVGAARAAREARLDSIVTLDMGGTSTDVAFHSPRAGLLNAVRDSRVGGHPVGVPALDIHTIGCGGGSLVRVDGSGVLHVGPESAGADPGPVCYGRGDEPTVTDAHVLLGHIASGAGSGFLGGELDLDEGAVARAFERLARRLGARPHAAAQGVLDVARAAMRRALGVMTMERGRDPASTPLVAFGGAGGLAAAALARSLGMPGALVPAAPGVLSALGMATADAVRDVERSVLAPLAKWPGAARRRAFAELAREARRQLGEAGLASARASIELSLHLRYRGQSFEIAVPEGADPGRAFHARHDKLYGWRLDEHPVELVQMSARASVHRSAPRVRAGKARAIPARAIVGERRAWFGRALKAARVDRAALAPGHWFAGPAIVEEFSGTTLVPPGWRARVTAGGHLWLEAK